VTSRSIVSQSIKSEDIQVFRFYHSGCVGYPMPQPVIRGHSRNRATDSNFAVSRGCATHTLTLSSQGRELGTERGRSKSAVATVSRQH